MSTATTATTIRYEPKQSWEWKRCYDNVKNYHDNHDKSNNKLLHHHDNEIDDHHDNDNNRRRMKQLIIHQRMKYWTRLFHHIIEYIHNEILQFPNDCFMVNNNSLDLLRAFCYDVVER